MNYIINVGKRESIKFHIQRKEPFMAKSIEFGGYVYESRSDLARELILKSAKAKRKKMSLSEIGRVAGIRPQTVFQEKKRLIEMGFAL